jgi:Acyl-coenzyme A:6-aminopenicillanic acid acyl-transferase
MVTWPGEAFAHGQSRQVRGSHLGATLREQNLGPVRWLVVSGQADDCFRALGGHMRAEIREAVTEWTSTRVLREHVSSSPGREQLAAVLSATQAHFAAEWAELAALADGAGVAVEGLALLNFRGDLGKVEGSFNCSDLAWRRGRSFIAHNEDQGASMTGRCVLLTLAIDGLPPVCAFWCPMFLPSNAFSVTDRLVFSIDSLTVPEPGPWAGRHFIARGLQRRCQTVDEAIGYLRANPSASGYAYTIGDYSADSHGDGAGTGRIVGVEAVRDELHMVEVGGPAGPLFWHTNHARFLPGTIGADACQRAGVLADRPLPDDEPDTAWFLRLLAGAPVPDGVRVDPTGKSPFLTLCTFVADLTEGMATLQWHGELPVHIPLRDLMAR